MKIDKIVIQNKTEYISDLYSLIKYANSSMIISFLKMVDVHLMNRSDCIYQHQIRILFELQEALFS